MHGSERAGGELLCACEAWRLERPGATATRHARRGGAAAAGARRRLTAAAAERGVHGVEGDGLPRDGHVPREPSRGGLHPQRDRRAGGPLQQGARRVERQLAGGLAVDGEDLVLGFDPGAVRGAPGSGRQHHQRAARAQARGEGHLHAHTGHRARRVAPAAAAKRRGQARGASQRPAPFNAKLGAARAPSPAENILPPAGAPRRCARTELRAGRPAVCARTAGCRTGRGPGNE
jgi:hypothetical protein